MSFIFDKLSKQARLAASIRARGFLAPTACSHCAEVAQLCYISSVSSRCSQCVSDHCSCSHSSNIDCMLFSFDIQQLDLSIVDAERSLDDSFSLLDSSHQQMLSSLNVAYQSFVAVQQCLTRLQELRVQRTRLSPLVVSSDRSRYVFLF